MSAILRSSRAWSKALRPASASATRSFHSPFAVLGSKNDLTSPPPASANVSSTSYEKQTDVSPEPTHHHSGGPQTYVVSEPDPANTFYKVPAGAYPTSLPYVNFTATEAPNQDVSMSSTSSSAAHPTLTRAVPHNDSGVGESSAVRHADAPGAMGQRGGSHGGAGLVDEKGTRPGEGSLASRNPQPDGEVATKFSKMGVKDAWTARS